MKKVVSLIAIASLLLAGCTQAAEQSQVRLVAHDSFAISDELIEQFELSSGYQLEIIRAGDAGALTNRLVLTKQSPIGDVVFGIDNTFQALAIENGVIDGELREVDYSDVCFNYDRIWFEEKNITPPTSFRDLVREEYRGLTVVTNPLTSSPGLAFLATTVAAFGESGFESYWRALKENDVKVSSGWEDAYFTEFSGSVGAGSYPIVLSYSSSPSAELREDGNSQTVALTSECFRQIEYVGLLTGASNKAGAQALIEFLLGKDFQTVLPELMYVYPVNPEVSLPETWAKFAPLARSTIGSDLDIASSRESWQQKWLAIFE